MSRLDGRAPRLDPDPTGSVWEPSLDLLWISAAEPQPGWWAELRAQHERTGLWPLLIGSLSEHDPERPWRDEDDLTPELIATAPGDHDPAEVLRGWWGESERGAPFPGLAAPGAAVADPDDLAAAVADEILADGRSLTLPRLGLVPSARGADAIADAAWCGPLNLDNDTAKFSAVLRSWEERFGVRVVAAGFDTLHLSVAAPPADLTAAIAVAAEHYAFCPDNVEGGDNLPDYAEWLVKETRWSFWWD
jgi:hypothetical protein